ncbi:MAG TPA: carboxypeptidase-like regulatory domain-containing protein [Terracidiphilus sp.]|jgi:hypothetical protein|nr:carboxypeptidase-like regulatory domain-containing protein [Terracidiphilus sp.]
MRQPKNRFFLLPLFLVLMCVGLYAQANSELTGIVTDQTGAVVAGAAITITDPGTGSTKTAESGATGLYDFNGLNPANYNLKVTAKGFETYEQNGIVVNVSATVRQDIKLTVGAEGTTITVSADALTVQTDSNVVSTLISSEQISEIATENRNFAALAALGLGVSSALPDSNTPTSVAANFTIQVNGLRQSHNIWLIDGGEADDRGGAGGMDIMPSQDAIAEFNMLTSNYPPDYGISSGATMSLSLKSGTQKFHGELYEFNRNTDYDANSYFGNLNKNPRVATHYNIFGGNVGGPLFIPKVYNTNRQKTFFFVNLEKREITGSTGNNVQGTIPTADIPSMGQDLTYVAPGFSSNNQIIVPNVSTSSWYYVNKLKPLGLVPNGCWNSGDTTYTASGSAQCKVLTGQVIPHSLFDPNGVLYLNSGVLPKVTTADDKASTILSLPIKVTDFVGRIDHKINDKWAILGHYMQDAVTQASGAPHLGWLWASYNTITSTLDNPSESAAIKISGTINPNLLVEGSINYDGNVINITDSPDSVRNLPAGWSVAPLTPSLAVSRKVLPSMEYMGPYGTAEETGADPWHNAARDYEPKLDISYTKGKHATKFGFSWNHYTKNQQVTENAQGDFSPSSNTNDSLMDLLLGLTSGYNLAQEDPIRHWVNSTPSIYAMDNWHVTPRLTLQLGLRYDALPHVVERNNYIANFDPNSYISTAVPIWTNSGTIDPSSATVTTVNHSQYPGYSATGNQFYLNGMRLAGVNAFPRGIVKNRYDTYQPRIGFSEDLQGNGKTVLRGGFGTFFERTQGNDIYNAGGNAPFAYDPNVGSPLLSTPSFNYTTGTDVNATGLPVFVNGAENLAVDNYNPPAVAMYSLGMQRELSPSVVWVVQYVGNMAWHQWADRKLNNLPLTAIGQSATVPNPYGVGTVQASLTCLAGDGGNHYDGDKGSGGIDANCKNGFGSTFADGSPVFPGGTNQFRSYQGWGDITAQEMATNGTYNGFQSGVRIQNRWGFSGELDYTYSHEIDIQSYDNSCCVSNPWNYKYDKGSGALDRRHIVSANYVYKLPFFAKSNGLVHSIAGGWELAGTIIDQTGVIQTVNGAGGVANNSNNGYDPVGLGGGYTVRPNVSGKMSYPKKMGQWFDTSKFSNVTPTWLGGQNLGFGSSGKDAVVGPGRVNFTTSLYKSFAMTERAHFELRFESFNTFNHTEPNNLSTSYNPQNGFPFSTQLTQGNTFGQVSSTWDPRNLELAGKFVF